MIRFWLFVVTVASLSICGRNSLRADERDELIHRVNAMKQEVAELRKHGHHDEAEQLAHKAAEMMKKVQRSESSLEASAEKELHSLRAKLEQLERAGRDATDRHAEGEVQEIRAKAREIRLEIEKIESRQRFIKIPPHFQERAEKLESMALRLSHMRTAAENLKAAAMHDMAHEVMKKAEHLEHELGDSKRELAVAIREFQEVRNAEMNRNRQRREMDGNGESPLQRELDSLRKELRNAQEELKRLRLDRDR